MSLQEVKTRFRGNFGAHLGLLAFGVATAAVVFNRRARRRAAAVALNPA